MRSMKRRDSFSLFVFDHQSQIFGTIVVSWLTAMAAVYDPAMFFEHMHLVAVAALICLFTMSIMLPSPLPETPVTPGPSPLPSPTLRSSRGDRDRFSSSPSCSPSPSPVLGVSSSPTSSSAPLSPRLTAINAQLQDLQHKVSIANPALRPDTTVTEHPPPRLLRRSAARGDRPA